MTKENRNIEECDIMELIKGPKHTPYVVLSLGRGAKTFNEIEKATRIPPSTLSRSLKILLKAEMIKTRPLTMNEETGCRGMWKYELTNKGNALVDVAEQLDVIFRDFWEMLK